jgi:ubiquinone/menaquinone biosynthesis C-methylase UbiE
VIAWRWAGRQLNSVLAISSYFEIAMHNTDYSTIASRYDQNPIRTHFKREPAIESLLQSGIVIPSILDLACGTANYILSQEREYPGHGITWFSCDNSPEMLAIAARKVPFAKLSVNDAAALPYPDETFDVIVCNFAFHHFTQKQKCITEIHRTLKPNGVFLMMNISPKDMPFWWVFRYFPSTRRIDLF